MFERGFVMSGLVVVWQQESAELVIAGWKQYLWTCNVDTRLLDLAKVAT